jgi:hypothetical protein
VTAQNIPAEVAERVRAARAAWEQAGMEDSGRDRLRQRAATAHVLADAYSAALGHVEQYSVEFWALFDASVMLKADAQGIERHLGDTAPGEGCAR